MYIDAVWVFVEKCLRGFEDVNPWFLNESLTGTK